MTTIAKTILEQLGGHKFTAMTGARNLTATNNGLRFGLPARFAKDGINVVNICLTPADEYDVEFLKVRGTQVPVTVAKAEGVYADMLQEIFTSHTGLDTHL